MGAEGLGMRMGGWTGTGRSRRVSTRRGTRSRDEDAATDSHNTTAAAEAGAAAKRALVKAAGLINGLTDGLQAIKDRGGLGDGEIRRRKDMIATSRVEREGLERLCNTLVSAKHEANGSSSGARTQLLNKASSSRGARTGRRVIGAPAPETAKTRELDNNGVLMLQQQEMQTQDQQVEQLTEIIRRQKQMGMDISEEVELQTEMLKALGDDVDIVQGKVKVARNRLKKL